MSIERSDAHYRKLEGDSNTEPIIIMEELITRLITSRVAPGTALDIAMAQKHLTRAGIKDGEGWKKEIQKSINYLTRAITGEWVIDTVKEQQSNSKQSADIDPACELLYDKWNSGDDDLQLSFIDWCYSANVFNNARSMK